MFRQVKYFLSLMCFISVAFMMYRVIQLESDNLQPKAEICTSCRLGDKAVEIRVGGGQQDDSSVKIVTPTKPRLKKAAVATKVRQSEAKKTNIAATTVRATTKAPAAKKATLKSSARSPGVTFTTDHPCSKERVRLVGPIVVDQSVPKSEDNIEDEWEEKGWVEKRGAWRPTECQAISKVAIVVPFRDREEQLKIFLRHMHPMLKRQLLDYRIVVIEQAGETPFNRGMLSNVGYKEASKLHGFNCFIFHDIDLLPENDNIHYGCPSTPTHLTVAIDKFNYRMPYRQIFGGATSFRREHFEKLNGYSNKYWGWGGEDDDLYRRVRKSGLKLARANLTVGRYKMVRIFHRNAKENLSRFEDLKTSRERMTNEGLSSLKYKVVKTVERPHYTKVTVDVNPNYV